VAVTSPQTEFALARGGRGRPGPVHARPGETKPPPVDSVLLRRILGAQRRAAATGLAGFLAFMIALPVVLDMIAPAQPRLGGVPVVWLVLGAGAYPVLVALAARHVRRIEAVEARIVEVYRAGREEAERKQASQQQAIQQPASQQPALQRPAAHQPAIHPASQPSIQWPAGPPPATPRHTGGR
jgi:hypothetical protein